MGYGSLAAILDRSYGTLDRSPVSKQKNDSY